MAEEITAQDCEELYEKFMKYTETAEQHEFPWLMVIHARLNATMAKVREIGIVENQKDARAMFRVVLKTIGQDASAYKEDTE